jgi:hypothetical protein
VRTTAALAPTCLRSSSAAWRMAALASSVFLTRSRRAVTSMAGGVEMPWRWGCPEQRCAGGQRELATGAVSSAGEGRRDQRLRCASRRQSAGARRAASVRGARASLSVWCRRQRGPLWRVLSLSKQKKEGLVGVVNLQVRDPELDRFALAPSARGPSTPCPPAAGSVHTQAGATFMLDAALYASTPRRGFSYRLATGPARLPSRSHLSARSCTCASSTVDPLYS